MRVTVFIFHLLTVAVFCLPETVYGQQCPKASLGDERRVCSHITDEMDGVVRKTFRGTVVDGNGEPIPDVVIEVYELKEDGALIATYKTGVDGKFCLAALPRGKYFVRVGWSRFGFNCIDHKLDIKGTSEKALEIMLPVGT